MLYHFHSLYHCCHSLSLPFVVTRCHSLYYSLSLFVTCATLSHSLSLVIPLVTRTTLCNSLSFVVTRTTRCHSLSLSFYKRSSKFRCSFRKLVTMDVKTKNKYKICTTCFSFYKQFGSGTSPQKFFFERKKLYVC